MAFKKSQIPAISLYSGLAAAGTSMIVTPHPVDLDGNKITMAALQTNPQLTIDPKVADYEEIIGFSGITDNGDDTATLTGLSRNLASSSLATPGTGKQHGAGAIIVFSLNPQDIDRIVNTEDAQTIAGVKTFSAIPVLPAVDATTDNQAIRKKQLDDTVSAGAPNMSLIVKGLAEEATAAEINAGTQAGATLAELAVNPKYLKDSEYYTQRPTADEKAALAGTSGTPSASNKFVTDADVTTAKTASKIARRDANGDVLVATTPTSTDGATSKAYVDGNPITYKHGTATRDLSTASGSVNTAHGLGRIPKNVRITVIEGSTVSGHNFSVGNYNGSTTSAIYRGFNNNNQFYIGNSTTNIINIYCSGSNDTSPQYATITIDATNIVLAWTKVGGGTGTAYIMWEVV